MLKRLLFVGALTVIQASSIVLAAGPQSQGVQQGAVTRPRMYSNYSRNSYSPGSGRSYSRTQPSTQPGYTGPLGTGPAYKRYSHLPYYMRAERKALGMFP